MGVRGSGPNAPRSVSESLVPERLRDSYHCSLGDAGLGFHVLPIERWIAMRRTVRLLVGMGLVLSCGRIDTLEPSYGYVDPCMNGSCSTNWCDTNVCPSGYTCNRVLEMCVNWCSTHSCQFGCSNTMLRCLTFCETHTCAEGICHEASQTCVVPTGDDSGGDGSGGGNGCPGGSSCGSGPCYYDYQCGAGQECNHLGECVAAEN